MVCGKLFDYRSTDWARCPRNDNTHNSADQEKLKEFIPVLQKIGKTCPKGQVNFFSGNHFLSHDFQPKLGDKCHKMKEILAFDVTLTQG